MKSFKDLTQGELRRLVLVSVEVSVVNLSTRFGECVLPWKSAGSCTVPTTRRQKMEIEKLLSSRLAQAKSFKKKKVICSVL